MRSLLKSDGTIPEPESIAAAYSRLHRLTAEITRIEQQLAGWVLPVMGHTWLTRADETRQVFTIERTQLREWIAKEERKLFTDAVKLLRTLHDEEVGFSPDEVKLLLRAEEVINQTGEGGDGRDKTGPG